jgi:hypothetical protein
LSGIWVDRRLDLPAAVFEFSAAAATARVVSAEFYVYIRHIEPMGYVDGFPSRRELRLRLLQE